MSLIEKPNILSLIILGGVVIIAVTYGFLTYTQSPDLEHYQVDPNYDFAYNFDKPNDIVQLPDELEEISGLAPWTDDGHLLAVQDEDGKLFVLNTSTGQVDLSFVFDKDKDYEGVARTDSAIYVLEQDGDLHKFTYVEGVVEYSADKIETDFSYRNDTEGIAYDKRSNSLLIVPKEENLDPSSNEDFRHNIYAYDLELGRLKKQPAFYIDEFEVGQAIYDQPTRYKLKPSGIAIDPLTGDIYVIASVGKIMVVIDRESEIKHIELLKENVFRQPEGLEFNSVGDLYISSEAKGKRAVLAKYSRQKLDEAKTQQDEQNSN